jgi:FdhE protein
VQGINRVTGNLLRKVFGASSAPAPDVVTALGDLERLAKERPELAGPSALIRDFLRALYGDPVREPAPILSNEHAATKLAGGVPLLRGEAIDLDVKAFQRRWLRLCAVVQRHQPGDAGKILADVLQKKTLDPRTLVDELLAGRAQAIHARADLLGVEPGLTATLLRLTLFPVLAHFDGSLLPFRQPVHWMRGYCPTCGSWPLLGEFRGLEQTRFLRCGMCAAEWEFPRLLCPFCGTRDHRLLGYLHVEGEESRYRAATCDACRGYVKMVSSLSALSGPQLLVMEVATTHLDLAALARNYLAPS